jgi:hypothetical protein
MTEIYSLAVPAFIGFCFYEVCVRIVQPEDSFIKRVGIVKYIIYFIVYSAFGSSLAAATASMATGLAYQIVIALVGGYTIPAGGRMMLATLVRIYFGALRNLLPQDRNEQPGAPTNQIQAEEIWVDASGKEISPAWIVRLSLIMGLPVFELSSRGS